MHIEQDARLAFCVNYVENLILANSQHKQNFYRTLDAKSFSDALDKGLFTAKSFARMYQTTYVTQLSGDLVIPTVRRLVQKKIVKDNKTVCIPIRPGHAKFLIEHDPDIFTPQNTLDFQSITQDSVNWDIVSRVVVFDHQATEYKEDQTDSVIIGNYRDSMRDYLSLLNKLLQDKQRTAAHAHFILFN